MTSTTILSVTPETNGLHGINVNLVEQHDCDCKVSFLWSDTTKKCWLVIFDEIQEPSVFISGERLKDGVPHETASIYDLAPNQDGLVEFEYYFGVLKTSYVFIDSPSSSRNDGIRYRICLPAFCDKIADRLKEMAEQGAAEAQYKYGKYLDFVGWRQGCPEAIKWLTLSAEQGHAKACEHLGRCYWWGMSTSESLEKAIPWLKKAEERLDRTIARSGLIEAYLSGDGCKCDVPEAIRLLKKNALIGDDWSMRVLSELYWEGDAGVQRELKEAYIWAALAVKYNHSGAGWEREKFTERRDRLEKGLPSRDIADGNRKIAELSATISVSINAT